MLPVFLMDYNLCDDPFTKVVNDQPGKYFLQDILHLFGMKIC